MVRFTNKPSSTFTLLARKKPELYSSQVCAELLERGGVDLLNDRDSIMISAMDYALQEKHEAVLEVTMSPRPSTSRNPLDHRIRNPQDHTEFPTLGQPIANRNPF